MYKLDRDCFLIVYGGGAGIISVALASSMSKTFDAGSSFVFLFGAIIALTGLIGATISWRQEARERRNGWMK